jgi:hypothetical protein
VTPNRALTPKQALAAALRHAFPFRRRVDDELSADMILASLPPGWRLTYDPSSDAADAEPRTTGGRSRDRRGT